MRAAIYTRVSTQGQADGGTSLQTQEDACRAYCAEHGFTIVGTFVETKSGAKLWERPQLTTLRETLIARKAVDVVVAYAIDRLSRDQAHLGALVTEGDKYGVHYEFVTEDFDRTPVGKMIASAKSFAAEIEREKIAERTMRGIRRKAENGCVVGAGKPPFGYRFTHQQRGDGNVVVGLAEDPTSSPIVRGMFRDAVTRSTLEIAANLNATGVPSPRNGVWRESAVNHLLRNSVYTGSWHYTDLTVPVPALVTHAQADAALDALVARNNGAIRRGRSPRTDDAFLLRGKLVCGDCGGPLVTNYNNCVRQYRCGAHAPSRARRNGRPVCALPDLNSDALEAECWRALSDTLLNPDVLAAGLAAAQTERSDADARRQADLAVFDAELAQRRKRLSSQLDELIDAGPEAKAALREKIAENERAIGKLDRERNALREGPQDGLSAADALSITTFAAQARAGLEAASPAERLALIDQLRVQGVIRHGGDVRIRRHAYTLEWSAAIPLVLTNQVATVNSDLM
jgi:site-specific DNA recombinase